VAVDAQTKAAQPQVCPYPLHTRRIIRLGVPKMKLEFTAVFRKLPEGYIGFVEELPGAGWDWPTNN
jgi:hypothetical protein